MVVVQHPSATLTRTTDGRCVCWTCRQAAHGTKGLKSGATNAVEEQARQDCKIGAGFINPNRPRATPLNTRKQESPPGLRFSVSGQRAPACKWRQGASPGVGRNQVPPRRGQIRRKFIGVDVEEWNGVFEAKRLDALTESGDTQGHLCQTFFAHPNRPAGLDHVGAFHSTQFVFGRTGCTAHGGVVEVRDAPETLDVFRGKRVDARIQTGHAGAVCRKQIIALEQDPGREGLGNGGVKEFARASPNQSILNLPVGTSIVIVFHP